MSRDDKLHMPSLAQHFDAPDSYLGHFGWVCGFSADALFLNDAAERFTRLTSAQRADLGRIALAVCLDPSNHAITLLEVPGVAHLPIKDKTEFRLLHAKVALLGFRHADDSNRWRLRLIVSTGNWTRQTLEQSLDLVWRVDVDSEGLVKPNQDTTQACADIKAASGLLQWIAERFDTRLLSAVTQDGLSETVHAKTQFEKWIYSCNAKAKGTARFFDNRTQSLLKQLAKQVKTCGNTVARNYLAMGSGFYEAARDDESLPAVPSLIIEALKKAGLLTRSSDVDLFVNPQACQAIAASAMALSEQGITTRPASQPESVFHEGGSRTLHAKFLFSANNRKNSNVCNSAWIYLGSGNLTHPGFVNKMSPSGGNLEAGVVFAPGNLYREKEKGIEPSQVVTNLLPIQWDEDLCNSPSELQAGGNMEPRSSVYQAPPIAWLNWCECAKGNELRWPEACDNLVVLDMQGNECARSETGFRWTDPQPRQVRCRWRVNDADHEGDLPVIDRFGRIAATQLPNIGVDEAIWQIAAFPLPQDTDTDEEVADVDMAHRGIIQTNGQAAVKSSYPIRQMMELVESIATKQTEIAELDWDLWCNRLEQTLGQAKECLAVKTFQEMGLNPLSPLRHGAFRPAFAEADETPAGRNYENTLARIEKAWGVDNLNAIGGQP